MINLTEFEKDLEIDIDNFYSGIDSKEDILQCLSCEKEECNNCLFWKNGV